MSDVASQVEHILPASSRPAASRPRSPALYSQALVGMVALTGQWWQDHRKPKRDEVAAHLVNLAWNGLRGLEHKPKLTSPTRHPETG